MGAQPIAAHIAHIREWAPDPKAVFYEVKTNKGRVLIFPEDVAGRTDKQLIALICARLNEQ